MVKVSKGGILKKVKVSKGLKYGGITVAVLVVLGLLGGLGYYIFTKTKKANGPAPPEMILSYFMYGNCDGRYVFEQEKSGSRLYKQQNSSNPRYIEWNVASKSLICLDSDRVGGFGTRVIAEPPVNGTSASWKPPA